MDLIAGDGGGGSIALQRQGRSLSQRQMNPCANLPALKAILLMMSKRESEAYLDRGRPTMRVDQREHGDLLIFDLDGDFDTTSAGPIKERIRSAIEEGHSQILLNLEGVPYIDSAGLGTLVSALKATREADGNVLLAGLTPQVKMVIELTRLQRIFNIFDSVEEALERLPELPVTEMPE